MIKNEKDRFFSEHEFDSYSLFELTLRYGCKILTFESDRFIYVNYNDLLNTLFKRMQRTRCEDFVITLALSFRKNYKASLLLCKIGRSL
jgi:hypothetical protein